MTAGLTGEQIARRARSEAALRARAVRFNPHLPPIEPAEGEPLRPSLEVADRLLALCVVGLRAGGDDDFAAEVVHDRGVLPLFAPRERAFMDDPDPDRATRARFSWSYEAAWVLFWALNWPGNGATLTWPDEPCDVASMTAIVGDESVVLAGAGLKPRSALLDAADLVLCQHWAVRQARLDGLAAPDGLDLRIVDARHRALNWIFGFDDGAGWDEVPTHT